MITVMIVTDNIKENELIAASIIGGFEHSICVITSTDKDESEQLIRTQKHDVDIFILKVRMKSISGTKLAQLIRSRDKYINTPILFITSINHNMVGFSELATYHGYRRENYISTPIQRIDVQGKIGLYLDRIIEAANSHQSHERVIFLEHTGGECFLEVRSILYAEVQDKDITLYTKKGAYILKRSALETLCKKVDSEYLLRCHKSFAVNINAVKEIAPAGRRNWTAVLENGLRCPVSQTYYLLIRAAYIEKATR